MFSPSRLLKILNPTYGNKLSLEGNFGQMGRKLIGFQNHISKNPIVKLSGHNQKYQTFAGRIFSRNLHCTCPQEHSEKNHLLKKKTVFFGTLVKIHQFFMETFSPLLSKVHSTCQEEHLVRKTFEKIMSFHAFSDLERKNFGFSAKMFRWCCQNSKLHSTSIEKHFGRKSTY